MWDYSTIAPRYFETLLDYNPLANIINLKNSARAAISQLGGEAHYGKCRPSNFIKLSLFKN
ncbi:hypothetical protein CPL00136_CDS0186 [Salmonella phage vB_SenS-3]